MEWSHVTPPPQVVNRMTDRQLKTLPFRKLRVPAVKITKATNGNIVSMSYISNVHLTISSILVVVKHTE